MRKRTDPDDWELRDQYDFSQGHRGKHAARFNLESAERPPAWFRDAARSDRQSWISETLRRAQDLEGLFVGYVSMSFGLDPRAAGEQVAESLEHPNEGALRRVLEDLGKGPLPVPADLRSKLDGVLRRRNWLVHKSLHVGSGDMEADSLRDSVSRLQELSRDLASLNTQLEELMKARRGQEGMTEPEFHARIGDALEKWLAA